MKEKLIVRTESDIREALNAGMSSGGLILDQDQLSPEFFDLRTRIAGELFQKFTNYQLPLALVIPDATLYGDRFRELAYEHRNHRLIRFFPSLQDAELWMDQQQEP